MKFNVTKPCEHCPFRRDVPPFLFRAEAIMAYEITVDGSTETVGENNNFATEQEARQAIEKLKAMGSDWAEGEYDVREIS